jgi:hypothetical protein
VADDVRDRLLRTRDLARRARRLANGLTLDADRDRLLRHAAELEAQAAELERTFEQVGPVPPVAQVVQVQVQQQQQQHQTEATQEAGPDAQKPNET